MGLEELVDNVSNEKGYLSEESDYGDILSGTPNHPRVSTPLAPLRPTASSYPQGEQLVTMMQQQQALLQQVLDGQ